MILDFFSRIFVSAIGFPKPLGMTSSIIFSPRIKGPPPVPFRFPPRRLEKRFGASAESRSKELLDRPMRGPS